jgi:hypothetical protein
MEGGKLGNAAQAMTWRTVVVGHFAQ